LEKGSRMLLMPTSAKPSRILVERSPVEGERDLVGFLTCVVVRRVVDVAGAVPGPASTVPIAGLQLESIAVGVDDVATARAQRADPGCIGLGVTDEHHDLHSQQRDQHDVRKLHAAHDTTAST